MMRCTLGLGLNEIAAGTRAFNPASIPGLSAWYDPSDISTLFQDAAMTVPVTGDGQPVGAMRDKSGLGYHMLQPAASQRPIYRTASGLRWLEFDGVDDFMKADGFSMGGSDEVTLATAVHSVFTGIIGTLCELSANSSATAGTFALFDAGTASSTYMAWRSRGTTNSLAAPIRGEDLPASSVYTCFGKVSSDVNIIRRNGGQLSSATFDQGAGTFVDDTLYIGARGGSTYEFEGKLYGLCLFNRVLAAAEVGKMEAYMANKSEVVL